MPAPFRYDRTFPMPVTPAELWAVLGRTDEYAEWWPWLRSFEGGELRTGAIAHCTVQAPLPYALHFDVHVLEVVERARVVTEVRGDLAGPARLMIAPAGTGCEARLTWELDLRAPLLRRLALVGRPLMAWAHDRIIEHGLDEFERRALAASDR
jgi:uncharacterized protein YndB with AHSA1/START domain